MKNNIIYNLEFPRQIIKRYPWRVALTMVCVMLVYAGVFQFFYIWMRYGVINAYASFKVVINTYLMNLLPLSMQWLIISYIVFVPRYNCRMAIRSLITFVLSVLSVGLINWTFIIATHEYVEWAGTFFNCFLIYLICYIVYYECVRRDAESQRSEALKELMDFRQRVMISQFQPHFLFNSLNILYSMIGQAEVEESRKFVLAISQIYRYILENHDVKIIPVAKEIDFMKDYLHILSIRYGHKLQVRYEGETPVDKCLVPFSLQLLLENVVKHNRLTSAEPLEVAIRYSEDRIVISNPIRPNQKPAGKSHKGYGLSYLKKTYESFDRQLVISPDESVFRVEVPLIPFQILCNQPQDT